MVAKLRRCHNLSDPFASLAQSVEHQTFNLRAAGSSPAGGFTELTAKLAFYAVDVGSNPT